MAKIGDCVAFEFGVEILAGIDASSMDNACQTRAHPFAISFLLTCMHHNARLFSSIHYRLLLGPQR